MFELFSFCFICSLWSWGNTWTACFSTCVMILHWVECRCARCWTSAANTLEIRLVTLPSPISENWSGWCWAAFPRYAVFVFVIMRVRYNIPVFFLYFYFGYSPESPQAFILRLVSAPSVGLLKYPTNNGAYADRTWCQDGWLGRNDPLTSVPCFVFLSLSPSFSQLDGLLTDRESLPERSKEIRERLRGKGLPSGKMSGTDTHIKHRAIRAEFACCVVKGTFERCGKCCLFRQWFQFLGCQQFMIKRPGSY